MKELNNFLDYLKNIKNYSSYTIINYQHDIKKYFDYLIKENIDYKNINYKQTKSYVYTLDKLKRSTILRNVTSLRSFYNYLMKENLIKENVFLLLEVNKKEKRLPKFNTYEVTTKLLESINVNNILELRNKLIIELLYSTGIRVSELVNIKLNDIDSFNKTIKIYGKGKKERIVLYGEYTLELFNLHVNNIIGKYLFSNKNGNKLTTRTINNIIYKLNHTGNKMSAHTFRHSFATDIINNGGDLKTVQSLLGHCSMATTSIYTHTSKERIRKDYLNAHPRAKVK